ncbi:hypothetical protein F2Q69_00060414 [Brassica cretica]|uniref:Uncharacterized protein n=1 Tax=Brassica cretica TaxID=69181 RepID=A0A8S9RJJ0_BRACR|nr:hypothetical protein F2Q69_00060414 [Brassica cretica]
MMTPPPLKTIGVLAGRKANADEATDVLTISGTKQAGEQTDGSSGSSGKGSVEVDDADLHDNDVETLVSTEIDRPVILSEYRIVGGKEEMVVKEGLPSKETEREKNSYAAAVGDEHNVNALPIKAELRII